MSDLASVYDPEQVFSIAAGKLPTSNPLFLILDDADLRQRLRVGIFTYAWWRSDPRKWDGGEDGEVARLRRHIATVGGAIEALEAMDEDIFLLDYSAGFPGGKPDADDILSTAQDAMIDLLSKLMQISESRGADPFGKQRTGPDRNARKTAIQRLSVALGQAFLVKGGQVPSPEFFDALTAILRPMKGTDVNGCIPNERELRNYVKEEFHGATKPCG